MSADNGEPLRTDRAMTGSAGGDDTTARIFIAHYLHDVAARSREAGHADLVAAAAGERMLWEQHGRLEGETARFVYL